MRYITIADLSETIRKNFYKIPHDIDFVIGIPRSGMLPATIISEFLNKPLIDIDSFCGGQTPTGGSRLGYNTFYGQKDETKKVLVVDDTIASGKAFKGAKEKLGKIRGEFRFIFMSVYFEDGGGKVGEDIDFYLENVCLPDGKRDLVIFEWNVFHQILAVTTRTMWDMDGVLCANPPDDFYTDAYEDYIKNATPLFIPSLEIGEICTFRISKYREITEEWLKRHGVKYGGLTMFNAKSKQERDNSGLPSHKMKAIRYKQADWAILFIESDDGQARAIHALTSKPVYCVETNKMYL